jgi:hypothetical protein
LRLAIAKQFQGNPKAESAIVAIEQNGSPTELERLTKYLDGEMMDDKAFASAITAIAPIVSGSSDFFRIIDIPKPSPGSQARAFTSTF